MEVIRGFISGLWELLLTTITASWGVVAQALSFIRYLVSGETAWPLVGALLCLAVAAVFTFARSRRGHPRNPEQPVPWDSGYISNFILVSAAFFLSVAGLFLIRGEPEEAALQVAKAAQRPIYWVLAVVCGLHLAWFLVDLGSAVTGWKRGRRICSKMNAGRTPYYMLLPTFIILGLFLYVPAVSIFYHSFFVYDIGGGDRTFGALDNYVQVFQDEIFWKSMRNMLLFTGFTIAATLIVPLIAAELIFHLRTERWRYYLRAAFLIPMVVPGVIIFEIWGYLYSDTGMIPLLGHTLGLGDALEGLLSRPQTALYAVMFVGFPFVLGINLLIFYAGLSNIDEAVWEAARMDGATPLKRFFLVDIPLLARQFKLLLILGIITGIQAFENVLVMTMGGPGWETMLPGLYMYRSAITFNEFGYGSAIGVILFLIVLTLALVVNRGVPGARA